MLSQPFVYLHVRLHQQYLIVHQLSHQQVLNLKPLSTYTAISLVFSRLVLSFMANLTNQQVLMLVKLQMLTVEQVTGIFLNLVAIVGKSFENQH